MSMAECFRYWVSRGAGYLRMHGAVLKAKLEAPAVAGCVVCCDEPAEQAGWVHGNVHAAAWRLLLQRSHLERLGLGFAKAGVEVVALKGAALWLLGWATPTGRSMSDLDLLVRPHDVSAAERVLRAHGFVEAQPMLREGMFPEVATEREYRRPGLVPVVVDLHVSALRPLVYRDGGLTQAVWCSSRMVGGTGLRVPGDAVMAVHLAAHAGLHGGALGKWRDDLLVAADRLGKRVEPGAMAARCGRWGVTAAVRQGLGGTGEDWVSAGVSVGGMDRGSLQACRWLRAWSAGMRCERSDWRERLAVWHAPRDGGHWAGAAGVQGLSCRGWGLAWRWAGWALWPSREHVGLWRGRGRATLTPGRWAGVGWRAWRLVRPGVRLAGRLLGKPRIRVERDAYGVGRLLAGRSFRAGSVVMRVRMRSSTWTGSGVPQGGTMRLGWSRDGRWGWHEVRGDVLAAEHSVVPTAELRGDRLMALRTLGPGAAITLDWGGCATGLGRWAGRVNDAGGDRGEDRSEAVVGEGGSGVLRTVLKMAA